MEWYWILWMIVSIMIAIIAFFLAAIDVIEDEDAFVLSVCVIVFPLGILVLTWEFLTKLYNFLNRHKDVIRKFLRIK